MLKRTQESIKIDGNLDELTWRNAPKSSPFWQSSPFDTAYTHVKTELAVAFDESNLYVSAKCFQKKEAYVVQSLKRDFGPGTTDLFAVLLDTYGDGQNAFSFSVSPLGVQREGLIVNGNEFSTDWDNRWFSATQNFDEFYTVEIAIPFKTLRYRPAGENNEWGVNFLRFDQSQNPAERSTWAFLPRFQMAIMPLLWANWFGKRRRRSPKRI
ncbi:MAG: carbohydrate binding family 9 domain-containing protein [Saprospiraceae bacterium]|nr:carbohydrate binding family 9 domain-containing protein [Saprospiraceae bacterium]